MGAIASAFGGAPSMQAANINKQDFSQALQQSSGQFNQAYGMQNTLAGQLAAQAQGAGPNPAQLMLNQSTDRNIMQNTGMLASQKGINPALAQRLAAQNAAQMGQQAAGQGATMAAQQQLGAQGQLAGVAGQMGGQALGMNQNLQNANAQQNNAAVSSQNGINAGNAGEYGAQMGLVSGMLGGAASGAGAAIAKGAVGTKAHGGLIAGRAQVSGDSPKNDTVPTMLSPGEIVIPRSVANDPEKAKEFIEHIKKQNDKKANPDGPSFGKIIDLHRKLGEALKKHGA